MQGLDFEIGSDYPEQNPALDLVEIEVQSTNFPFVTSGPADSGSGGLSLNLQNSPPAPQAPTLPKRGRGRPRKVPRRRGASSNASPVADAAIPATIDEESPDLQEVPIVSSFQAIPDRARRFLEIGLSVGVILECSEEVAIETLVEQISSHKSP